VTDLHEENLRAEGLSADVDLKVPLGIAAGVTYDLPSGLRWDVTLGPTFFIGGDVSHFELPLGATVGYNFDLGGDASPFVRRASFITSQAATTKPARAPASSSQQDSISDA
jgi:hypothetical protein